MTQYRGRISSGSTTLAAPQHPPTTNKALRPAARLAARYGLATMEPRRSSGDMQTIDQELSSYVTANPSPKGTEPLAFWEVCRITLTLSTFLTYVRFLEQPIQHFSELQWITFPYRLLQFLVNASFPLVQKPPQRDVTALAPFSWRRCKCSSSS